MKKKKGIIIGLVIIIVVAILLLLRGCSKEKYSITFEDYDGTVLQVVEVKKNELPVFNGNIEREADDNYAYSFLSWDKELVPATKDETYKAIYSSSLIDSGNNDTTRNPNSSTETIDFTEEEVKEETEEVKEEEKQESDLTNMLFWVVTFDQYDNELDRYTAKYGSTVYGPNGEEVIVHGNVRFYKTVEEEPQPQPKKPEEEPIKKGSTITIDGLSYKVLSIDEENVAKVLTIYDVADNLTYVDAEMVGINTTVDDGDTTLFEVTCPGEIFIESETSFFDFRNTNSIRGINYAGTVIENYMDNDFYDGLSDDIKNAIVEKDYYQKMGIVNYRNENYTIDFESDNGTVPIGIVGQVLIGAKKVRLLGLEDIIEYFNGPFNKADLFELLYDDASITKLDKMIRLSNASSYDKYHIDGIGILGTFNYLMFPVPYKPHLDATFKAVFYVDLDKLEYSK